MLDYFVQPDNILLEDLAPMQTENVAVIIGRFNPPTRGHAHLIKQARSAIKKHNSVKGNGNLKIDPVIVVIGGGKTDNDKSKNPLTVDQRISFLKSCGYANGLTIISASNAFAALSEIRNHKLEPIAVVAGEDRADSYMTMLDKYFLTNDDKPIKHYKFSLNRDNSAMKGKNLDDSLSTTKVENISASLARRAVELGYYDEFKDIIGVNDSSLGVSESLAKITYKHIRTAMGLKV